MSVTAMIAVGGFVIVVITNVVVITQYLNKMKLNIEQIRVALFGIDGENGLRSELREVKEAVKALQDREHDKH